MARVYENLKYGTLGADLTIGNSTINFGSDPGFETLISGNSVTIAVGDFTAAGTEIELIEMTAFTSGNSTGTVTRAAEGTTQRSHPTGTEWRHVTTVKDLFYTPPSYGRGLQHGEIINTNGSYWTPSWGDDNYRYEGFNNNYMNGGHQTSAPSGVTGSGAHFYSRFGGTAPTTSNQFISHGCWLDFGAETTLSWKESMRQFSGTMTSSARVERREVAIDGVVVDTKTYTYTSGAVTTATAESVVVSPGRHYIEFRHVQVTHDATAIGELHIGVLTMTPIYSPLSGSVWMDLQNGTLKVHNAGTYSDRTSNPLDPTVAGVWDVDGSSGNNVAIGNRALAAQQTWYGPVEDSVAIGVDALAAYDSISAGASSRAMDAGVSVGAYAESYHPGDVVIGAYAAAYRALGTKPAKPTGMSATATTGGTLPQGMYEYGIIHYEDFSSSFTIGSSQKYVAVDNGDNAVDLTWTDAGSYPVRIYRRFSYSNHAENSSIKHPWKFIAEVSAGTQAYTDNGDVGYYANPDFYGNWGVQDELYRIVIGYGATTDTGTDTTDTIIIGANSSSGHANAVVIGGGNSSDKENQVKLGTGAHIVTMSGGLELGLTSESTNYVVDASNKQTVVLMDATGGARSVTLPAVASGRTIVVKKTDATGNAVTVDTPGSETIDGASTYSLPTQYNSVRLVSDGTNWFVI